MTPEVLLAHDGQRVSPGLKPLLEDAYEQIQRVPADLAGLKLALVRLLEFLASPIGRTHANCVETDRFFFMHDDWPVKWEQLPEAFTLVLGDIAGILHDTISAPSVAENFDSTPEGLLARVRELSDHEGAV